MEYEGNQIILKNPSWWERRTDLERRVMIVTFILFLLIIGLIICLLVILLRTDDYDSYYPFSNRYDYDMMPIQEYTQNFMTDPHHLVCMEPGCIHSASKTISFLDTTVDPCQNFYKFACGGFLNHSHIAENRNSVTPFDINQRMVERQLKTIFEEHTQYKDIKPVASVKRLYSLCMDTETIENDSLDTIKTILRHIGGWPVLEGYGWNENEFDWKEAVFKMRRMGLNPNYFLSLEVVPDALNSTHYTLELDSAYIEPEEELFLTEGAGTDFSNHYFSYVVDIAVLFGADLTFAVNEMKAALEFEIALAKISNTRKDGEIGNLIFNTMTISQLQTTYPNIAWLEYINGVIDMPEFKVGFGDAIIVRVPQYLTDLENMLRWNSKRVLANYISWRTVKYSINYLTAQLRDRQAAFYRDAYGIDNREPRWAECVNLVYSGMPFAVGFIYVDKYVRKETKEVVFEMVTNIRNQIIELIKAVDWMDDITRVSAYEKAEAITTHTAYSEEYLSVKRLQRYYSQLEFSRTSYLKSVLNLWLFKKDKYFKKLHKYVINSEWEETDYSVGVRPYYSVTKNKLDIPNGILQGTFFSTDKPQYFNYGALGYLIAHEIAHGFDETGRRFDKNGNSVDWWTDFTRRAFIKKAMCLKYRNNSVSEQFSDKNGGGLNDHDINFANQGGLKAAYFAYNQWVERYGQEFQLPSLDAFTPHQLFWVSAAQTQCERYHPNYLKAEGYSEAQTPAQFQLHEALSNMEYFARDFHCHLGSPMNPVRKCHVW